MQTSNLFVSKQIVFKFERIKNKNEQSYMQINTQILVSVQPKLKSLIAHLLLHASETGSRNI